MLAHELRNPLAPMTTALALLERSVTLDGRDRQALAMARRQTAQLKRLVDDLLEVTRITRGMIELRLEPMLVATAVFSAAESVTPAIEARGQRLAVELPPRQSRIVADSARVAQVLENLLNNASKYTQEGGEIRIRVTDLPEAVEIVVQDDGIGIERSHIDRIFGLFAQADVTLDRARGGLGIGLALVKRLVELHGGVVTAASPGRGLGSTFTVRLPRAGPPAERAAERA
jgi:signal transduction histidine kinase